MTRFKITQSLLSAWQYSTITDNGYDDFVDALNRKRKPQTKQMLDGIRFESCLNNALDGIEIPVDHEWRKPLRQLSRYLDGSQKQVSIYKDVTVDGVHFLLNGVLDFLRAGIIYDTKFSKTYAVGKYRTSPQHPMYFELVPEARRFEYLISDGQYVYREAYTPEDVEPITVWIKRFMAYLDAYNLAETYIKNWRIE